MHINALNILTQKCVSQTIAPNNLRHLCNIINVAQKFGIEEQGTSGLITYSKVETLRG